MVWKQSERMPLRDRTSPVPRCMHMAEVKERVLKGGLLCHAILWWGRSRTVGATATRGDAASKETGR